MKQYFLKASAITALSICMYAVSMAQETPPPPPPASPDMILDKPGPEEIIIKQKNDKDTKLTVEIKNGQVFVNGKPMSEFNDENIVVIKRKAPGSDDEVYTFRRDNGPSPFRDQAWGFGNSRGGDNRVMTTKTIIAFLGVASENADDKGAKIKDVSKGSAAEKAGLKKGDIITKINNDRVINNPEELTQTIHDFKPGEKITVTYTRDGKEQKTTAMLGKTTNEFKMMLDGSSNQNMERQLKVLSEMDQLRGGPRSFNFSFRPDDRPRIGIKAQDTEDDKGAKVLDVDDESPADKAGVKEDDIITQFDGKTVNNAGMLAKLARENMDKPTHKITILRDGKTQELEIKTPKKLNTAEL
jgi:serine protease Do